MDLRAVFGWLHYGVMAMSRAGHLVVQVDFVHRGIIDEYLDVCQ